MGSDVFLCIRDKELYRQILGIEGPWKVEQVELRLKEGQVFVKLRHETLPMPPAPSGSRIS